MRSGGKAENDPAERVDQQELNEIVERESEEAVDVAADDPTHPVSIQALLTVLTFSRNGSRDCSNHAVALAEQIQLSGLVQGEPQIDPARTGYRRGSR